jgi:hypothetical protein
MTVEATVNANQLLAVLLHSVGDEERMESCLRLSPTGFFHHSFGREHRNLGGEARFVLRLSRGNTITTLCDQQIYS